MGKDLKGKELGKGICQRKDGLYFARCQIQGNTHSSYFKTAKEAKSWLKELDKKPKAKRGMTVDQWYQYWMTNLISDLAPNTRRNYSERYHYNVGPYIGDIYLTELKPMHCKQVLNQMEPRYATSSIIQTYITMGTMLKAAMDNDLINKHPLTGIRVNASKIADRTAEIAIQRKLLSDYIRMVEQAAIEAEPELYSYILKAVTENLTFVVLKQAYDMPCERDMFYDRRRKFYWALSRVR